MVIGGDYCIYCESGDRRNLIYLLRLWWKGEVTHVTVIVVIGGAYCISCDSGDRWSLLLVL